jgi:ABC-2 type transport system permease protein
VAESGTLTAYRRLLAAQIRSQAQYRASLVVEIVGSVGYGFIDTLTVLVLFNVTRTVGGFGWADTVLMTGLGSLAFALADLAVGNIERIRVYVRTGLLDAVLVRPLGALPQLLVMDFSPRRVGRVLFCAGLLAAGVRATGVALTPPHVGLLVLAPLAGATLFGAIFVTSATVAFWWIDSGEFANAVTYGGRDFVSYPVTVYGPVFRGLFAYGLGFAFVGYYPALTVTGRSDPLGLPGWLGWAAPGVAGVACAVAATVWRLAIRHYRSTGS